MEQTPEQIPASNNLPPVAPPVPPAPSISPTSWAMAPKKKGNGVFKIIGILLIVVVVGVGIALATRIWDPVWSPFRPDPQTTLENAFSKMSAWKTQRTDAIFGVDVVDEIQNISGKILMEVVGDSDKENKKGAASIDFSLDYKGQNVSQKFTTKISLDSIGSGTDAYIKLKKVDLPPAVVFMAAMAGVDIIALQDQWIKIDSTSLPSGVVGVQNNLSQDQQQQVTKIAEELQNIISGISLSKVQKQLPNEIVDGQKSYHYLVVLDREGVKQVLAKFMEKIPSLISTMGVPTINPERNLQVMNQQIDEFFNNVGDITYEVFIGMKDGEIHRLKIEKGIDASKFSPNQKGNIAVSMDVYYSNINKPVNIQVPSSFKTLQEILTPIKGKL